MKRKVVLHGEAAKRFGKTFILDVQNLQEAGRALAALRPGFREFAVQRQFRCVVGDTPKAGYQLGEEHLNLGLGKKTIHIMPVLEGAGGGKGGGGIGKLLAGVLLVGVGLFLVPALGGTLLGMSATQVTTMGLGMAFMGISSLIAAKNKDDKGDDSNSQFSGSIPMAKQGDPIRLIYGRTMVRNVAAISAGIDSSDLTISTILPPIGAH